MAMLDWLFPMPMTTMTQPPRQPDFTLPPPTSSSTAPTELPKREPVDHAAIQQQIHDKKISFIVLSLDVYDVQRRPTLVQCNRVFSRGLEIVGLLSCCLEKCSNIGCVHSSPFAFCFHLLGEVSVSTCNPLLQLGGRLLEDFVKGLAI